MSGNEEDWWRREREAEAEAEAAAERYYAARQAELEEQLRRIGEAPVFAYLAVHGDAIEARVKRCLAEPQDLMRDGYHGAALTRAVSGIEVTIRFFLVRPLAQGAFLLALRASRPGRGRWSPSWSLTFIHERRRIRAVIHSKSLIDVQRMTRSRAERSRLSRRTGAVRMRPRASGFCGENEKFGAVVR